jgi:hypothetical protein
VTASLGWPNTPSARSSERSQYQVAAPAESRTPTCTERAKVHTRVRMEGWRQNGSEAQTAASPERSSSATLFAGIHFDIVRSSAVNAQDELAARPSLCSSPTRQARYTGERGNNMTCPNDMPWTRTAFSWRANARLRLDDLGRASTMTLTESHRSPRPRSWRSAFHQSQAAPHYTC